MAVYQVFRQTLQVEYECKARVFPAFTWITPINDDDLKTTEKATQFKYIWEYLEHDLFSCSLENVKNIVWETLKYQACMIFLTAVWQEFTQVILQEKI